MTPIAIAGMQLNLSAVHDNVSYMRSRLDLLMHIYPWVEMVVFSELAAFGPSPRRAQRLPGPVEDDFREMARKHGIWLLPGTHVRAEDGRPIYNTAMVIDPYGDVVGRYRKMFPFRPYEEGVEAGEEFLVFDVPGIARFGVSICYDMWFPETSRTLAAMGAEVILHPTMTGTIDRSVELAIAQATAAQQQLFFVDINGAGDGGNGRSIIVGPYGDVLYTSRALRGDDPDRDRHRPRTAQPRNRIARPRTAAEELSRPQRALPGLRRRRQGASSLAGAAAQAAPTLGAEGTQSEE